MPLTYHIKFSTCNNFMPKKILACVSPCECNHKPFINRSGKLKLFEGLFSVSSTLLANLPLLKLSESSLDKSCSSLEEKHFKTFYNTLCVFISFVLKENLQFQS